MTKVNKVQSFINTSLLWYINPSSSIKENDSKNDYEKENLIRNIILKEGQPLVLRLFHMIILMKK